MGMYTSFFFMGILSTITPDLHSPFIMPVKISNAQLYVFSSFIEQTTFDFGFTATFIVLKIFFFPF